MTTEIIHPSAFVKGEVRMHRVHPPRPFMSPDILHRKGDLIGGLPLGWQPLTKFQQNALLYEWGAIFGNLLLKKGLQYGIGGMYIEFENVASPGDPVTVPTFTRDADEGVEYYNALSGSPDRDYLRIPLTFGTIDSTNETNFPKGNRPIFFAQTSGVLGTHGKTYSDVVNSTVYGGALVAFVDDTDYTRDIVLSRVYFDVDKQQVKLATSELGLEWRLNLQ